MLLLLSTLHHDLSKWILLGHAEYAHPRNTMSLFNNLIQLFDKFGRAKSPTQLVEGPQATELLKNVDTMLDESYKMIMAIKSKVPEKEFKAYEHDHNQLYVMVVDVKSDVRERENNQIFFASDADRMEFYVRMRKLLSLCDAHHTDVLSASRKAYLQETRKAITSAVASTDPVSTLKEGSPQKEWLSIVSEYNSSLELSEDHVDMSSLSYSGSESSSDSQRFIATVAQIPRSALATEEDLKCQLPDDDSYYRILICGNKRKRAVVVDPNPHLISANYSDEDALHSQDEILRVGDMLMKSDPQQLEGHQVVHSYRGLSFISSFISSWNYNNLPLGGMV
ncbi:hypothetical protein OPQ81_000689 [Rhizoctonia solani]|nr:hypothetical protein OPQ81_000689 [Rhizoctonia solani]